MQTEKLVVVRGGGDLATGTIYKLHQCGFSVLVTEIANPSCIRREVAFSECVYRGEMEVEGVTCVYAKNLQEAEQILSNGKVALLVDEKCQVLSQVHPLAVVDAIIAKKNLGTHLTMASIVIALGPGFCAGKDVHAVIETSRGHNLGRVIYEGCAKPNTGVPGLIAGYGKERVIHAPASGTLRQIAKISDIVHAGDVIAKIGDVPVFASIDGVLRGLIREGYPVKKGLKIADIDPRIEEQKNCFTISDKARCIAGGVLEAILHLRFQQL
jgi:xanthine dehydrogenase accessory factor